MKLVIGRKLIISAGDTSISGKVAYTDDLGFAIEDEAGDIYHIPGSALTDKQCKVVDELDRELCEFISKAA